MFNNIGSKIKTLAIFLTIFGMLLFGGLGIYYMTVSFLSGLITLIIGIVGSWIGSFVLYGFGELIEKTTEIADNTKKLNEIANNTKKLTEISLVDVIEKVDKDLEHKEKIDKIRKTIINE